MSTTQRCRQTDRQTTYGGSTRLSIRSRN